jgi:hypothetical protein
MNSRERSLLVALVLAAIGSAVVVGWFMGDHSLREWLLSFAGSAEFFGLVLVASPELVPRVMAAFSRIASGWMWLRTISRRGTDALRRVLGLPRRGKTVTASGALVAVSGFGASGRVSIEEGASLERKVEYLLRRDQELQAQHKAIDSSLRGMPDRWRADIEAASAGLRDEHEAALQQLRDRHLRARLTGIAMLALGVALATWGNLI